MCKCISYNRPQPYQNVQSVLLTAPEWAGSTKPVYVDACIAPVIKALWAEKIWTFNSCCGHNGEFPRSVIVNSCDRRRAGEVIARLDDTVNVGAWELVWSKEMDRV